MNLLINIIGTKFSAIITYIGNCLRGLRVTNLTTHTVNVTPATNIDGIALSDNMTKYP